MKQKNSKRIAWIIRIGLLIGLIGFFCPFCMVSCSGEEVLTVSGIDLMGGFAFMDEMVDPNPLLVIAVILAVIGMIRTIRNRGYKLATAQSVIALLCVIGFRIEITKNVMSNFVASNEEMIDVAMHFKMGWYLAFLGFALASLAFIIEPWISSKQTNYMTCPVCEKLTPLNATYCNECGSKIEYTDFNKDSPPNKWIVFARVVFIFIAVIVIVCIATSLTQSFSKTRRFSPLKEDTSVNTPIVETNKSESVSVDSTTPFEYISIDSLDVVSQNDTLYGLVSLTFTNHTTENTSFISQISVQAFQNGVALSEEYLYSLLNDEEDLSTKEIRPGTTIPVQIAFKIRNLDDSITVEVSERFSYSDQKIIQEFDLTAFAEESESVAGNKINAFYFLGKPMSEVVDCFGENIIASGEGGGTVFHYDLDAIPYLFSGNLDLGEYNSDEIVDYIQVRPGAYIDEYIKIDADEKELAEHFTKNYQPLIANDPTQEPAGFRCSFDQEINGNLYHMVIDYDINMNVLGGYVKLKDSY